MRKLLRFFFLFLIILFFLSVNFRERVMLGFERVIMPQVKKEILLLKGMMEQRIESMRR